MSIEEVYQESCRVEQLKSSNQMSIVKCQIIKSVRQLRVRRLNCCACDFLQFFYILIMYRVIKKDCLSWLYN
jgi:hypothetical protein